MIDFSQATVFDCFPNKNSPELQAFSYALKNACATIKEKIDASMVYVGMDVLPEKILDVLAVELRSMYYDQNLSIDQKREIIKNTLAWHKKAGTPAAVKELVQAIFGEGQVEEWFDFNPEEGEIIPGTFDIITNAQLTDDMLEEFRNIVHRVKNARSQLRRVVVLRKNFINQKVAIVHTARTQFEIRDGGLEGGEDA